MRVSRILICLVQSFVFNFCSQAQAISLPQNPVFAGNGVYSNRFHDLFSFLINPASLALANEAGVAVGGENRYGLKDIVLTGTYGMGGMGAIGMMIGYEGDRDYNHSRVGLGYGKNLGRIGLGARFNYEMVKMAGYGNVSMIGFELGSIWKVTEKFYSGMQLANPRGAKLPSQFSAGAGYEVSEQVFISANIIKEENKVVNVQAGLLYALAGSLYLSLGINSATASPAFMLGWEKKMLRIAVAGSMHPQLGPATALYIQFFGKKKNDAL